MLAPYAKGARPFKIGYSTGYGEYSQGNIYVSNGYILARISSTDTIYKDLPSNNGRWGEIVFDKNDQIWLPLSTGINVIGWEKSDSMITNSNSGLAKGVVISIAKRREEIWIAFDQAVQKFSGGKWETFTNANAPLPLSGITRVLAGQDGNIYIQTKDGIHIFHQHKIITSTELKENNILNNVLVYPNPSSNAFHLNDFSGRKAKVYTSTGVLIQELKLNQNLSFGDAYGVGMYILVVESDNHVVRKSLIKL